MEKLQDARIALGLEGILSRRTRNHPASAVGPYLAVHHTASTTGSCPPDRGASRRAWRSRAASATDHVILRPAHVLVRRY